MTEQTSNQGEYAQYQQQAKEIFAQIDPKAIRPYNELVGATRSAVDMVVADQYDSPGQKSQYRKYSREAYAEMIATALQYQYLGIEKLAERAKYPRRVKSLAEVPQGWLQGNNANNIEMMCLMSDGGVLVIGVGAFGREGGAPGAIIRMSDPGGNALQAEITEGTHHFHGMSVQGGLKVVENSDYHWTWDILRGSKSLPWSMKEYDAVRANPLRAMQVEVPYGARVVYMHEADAAYTGGGRSFTWKKGDLDAGYMTLRDMFVRYSPGQSQAASQAATRAVAMGARATMRVAGERAMETVNSGRK
jgi:hypothetical protein